MTSLPCSWHRWAATASAACVARLRVVADWWQSRPTTNTLACLCSCQWWTFWTYLVTVNNCFLCTWILCFTPCTLNALGNILRVHYKSMKCDVSFSQGNVNTLFRWGENVFHACVTMFFLLTAVQKLFLKIKRVFPELWSQMYSHVFLWNIANSVCSCKSSCACQLIIINENDDDDDGLVFWNTV